MPVSDWQLNRFERTLFRVAMALGALIVAVRLAAMAAFWFMRH
jgi:hypothetical protein